MFRQVQPGLASEETGDRKRFWTTGGRGGIRRDVPAGEEDASTACWTEHFFITHQQNIITPWNWRMPKLWSILTLGQWAPVSIWPQYQTIVWDGTDTSKALTQHDYDAFGKRDFFVQCSYGSHKVHDGSRTGGWFALGTVASISQYRCMHSWDFSLSHFRAEISKFPDFIVSAQKWSLERPSDCV